jgi:hypothetical protein
VGYALHDFVGHVRIDKHDVMRIDQIDAMNHPGSSKTLGVIKFLLPDLIGAR